MVYTTNRRFVFTLTSKKDRIAELRRMQNTILQEAISILKEKRKLRKANLEKKATWVIKKMNFILDLEKEVKALREGII